MPASGLQAQGLNAVFLNVSWSAVEPTNGAFVYTELDQDMANAAAAGIKVIPSFVYGNWPGDPAPWITDFEEVLRIR